MCLSSYSRKNIYGKTPYDLTNNIEIKKILENYLNNNQNQYHNIKIHESSNSHLKSLMKNYSNNEKYKSNMNIIDNDKLNQIYVNTPNYNTLTRTKTFLENLIPNKRSSPECIIREDKKFKKDQFFSQKIKPKANKYNNNTTNNSNLNKSSKNNLMIKSKQKSNKIILNSCLKSSKENPTVNNLNISSLSVKKKSNNIISSASDKKLPEARLKKKSANKNRKQENNSLQKTKKIMQEFSTLENNNKKEIKQDNYTNRNKMPKKSRFLAEKSNFQRQYNFKRNSMKNYINGLNQLEYNEFMKFINNTQVLCHLTECQKSLLAGSLKKECYQPNEYVTKQNDKAKSIYIIKEGQLKCIDKDNE